MKQCCSSQGKVTSITQCRVFDIPKSIGANCFLERERQKLRDDYSRKLQIANYVRIILTQIECLFSVPFPLPVF